MLYTALKPLATLKASLEANYDRRTPDGHGTDKATYRGTSYRSAQKCHKAEKTAECEDLVKPQS